MSPVDNQQATDVIFGRVRLIICPTAWDKLSQGVGQPTGVRLVKKAVTLLNFPTLMRLNKCDKDSLFLRPFFSKQAELERIDILSSLLMLDRMKASFHLLSLNRSLHIAHHLKYVFGIRWQRYDKYSRFR